MAHRPRGVAPKGHMVYPTLNHTLLPSWETPGGPTCSPCPGALLAPSIGPIGEWDTTFVLAGSFLALLSGSSLQVETGDGTSHARFPSHEILPHLEWWTDLYSSRWGVYPPHPRLRPSLLFWGQHVWLGCPSSGHDTPGIGDELILLGPYLCA